MPATAAKRKEVPARIIRDPAFAKRFTQAADSHPHCPPKHSGRLGWVSQQMAAKGHPVSNETVRKWFDGEATPRKDKAPLLAEIMQVDVEWLTYGVSQALGVKERKVRNATADGVVNLVAGLIAMDGGHPAFPEDDEGPEDLHAIIKGGHYALTIVAGETHGRQAKFNVPAAAGDTTIVIGVIRDGFAFDLFELTSEVIEKHGTRRGSAIEVSVDGSKLRRIEGFDKRL